MGAGESGAAVPLRLQQLAHEVFAHAFVDATRLTLLLPIAAVLLAAVFTLAVRAEPAPVRVSAPVPD